MIAGVILVILFVLVMWAVSYFLLCKITRGMPYHERRSCFRSWRIVYGVITVGLLANTTYVVMQMKL